MNFSDDSDRATFAGDYTATLDCDPAPDFEGMEYDDWRRVPRCGYPDTECPGCRHCFPPDFEAIHTGFERYDRPDFYRVTRELRMLADLGYALDPRFTPGGSAVRDTMIGFDARLLRAADYKLARICERAETHADAVREYGAWVERVKSRRI